MIHRKIDKIDEERYDLQMKVTKSDKEVPNIFLNKWYISKYYVNIFTSTQLLRQEII